MDKIVQTTLHNVVVLLIVCLTVCKGQLLEGLYCGRDNCYDVLNVTRESTVSEIGKAYRQLARIHHPDRHRTKEAKEDAAEKFKVIGMVHFLRIFFFCSPIFPNETVNLIF